MRIIQLTKEQVCLVDDDDYEWLTHWKWQAQKSKKKFIAKRSVRINGAIRALSMHRAIMVHHFGENDLHVDHIDGNPLNNQKNNLRWATNQENSRNRVKFAGASIYKGVCWSREKNKWKAQINDGESVRTLGYFLNEIDAAVAYNQKAVELFGEFAHVNSF